uniref:Nucleolar protein 10 n=1 Tax=Sinocyclocheilus rhinocerous TaxID=307959 RepID=A0A673KDL5_9TELE
MQVSSVNNVKIYNLSHGKSLPEVKFVLFKRIELIQDFEMPTVCTSIRVSRDGQFILAAGTYKPRVRCYDTYQLSLKFERCLESDGECYNYLFLHIDRYVEFHSQHGHYYKTRIPKFGRDFSYHYPSCDLYFVGASSEVFRLNLEQGRFLNSLQTDAAEINVCDINPVHQLFAAGTLEGRVDCWDPRVRSRVAVLDCALSSITDGTEVEGLPAVSALKFNGSLGMAVGTSTGQVLVYDLRSSRPLLVKDHYYGLPIKSLHFHNPLDLVLSADSKIIKMWNKDNVRPALLVYFISRRPALGPAPRWCSFLDNLTEELEENPESTIYDDYKFVTRKDLENLGLTHLIGSPLLRAYMHGFFMDIRLYHKVKTMANPFAYEEYRKDRIRQKIEESRAQRVQLKKLPKVNKDLAMKLMEESELSTKKKKKKANLLTDDRFKVMFENPDYQVDERSEEFRLLNPIVSKVGEKRRQKLSQIVQQEEQDEEEEEVEGRGSSEEEESSDDDDKSWVQEVREQRRLIRAEERERTNRQQEPQNQSQNQPRFYQIKAGEEFRSFGDVARKQKMQKTSLEERLQREQSSGRLNLSDTAVGSKQLTFTLKKVRMKMATCAD